MYILIKVYIFLNKTVKEFFDLIQVVLVHKKINAKYKNIFIFNILL